MAAYGGGFARAMVQNAMFEQSARPKLASAVGREMFDRAVLEEETCFADDAVCFASAECAPSAPRPQSQGPPQEHASSSGSESDGEEASDWLD
jgi:hypothetical protein